MELEGPWKLVATLVAGSMTGAAAFYFARRWIVRWSLRRRFRRGIEGEARAKRFLEGRGFRILAEQPELEASMKVDGRVMGYRVRADFLVKKGRRRAVVEVKTGARAVDPASPRTRRQIHEYARLYDVDDVYLFDAEEGVLRRIELPGERAGGGPRWLWWLSGVAAGAGMAWWLSGRGW